GRCYPVREEKSPQVAVLIGRGKRQSAQVASSQRTYGLTATFSQAEQSAQHKALPGLDLVVAKYQVSDPAFVLKLQMKGSEIESHLPCGPPCKRFARILFGGKATAEVARDTGPEPGVDAVR